MSWKMLHSIFINFFVWGESGHQDFPSSKSSVGTEVSSHILVKPILDSLGMLVAP
jgi:hypothetical protein